jgi:16S rRNA (guanine966-N2)-methyltransferase
LVDACHRGSRGAAHVVCVEQDATLVRAMRETQRRLQDSGSMHVEQADALAFLRRQAPGSFEVVMLDPPFEQHVHAVAIEAAQPLVAPLGFLYVEANLGLSEPEGWTAWRHLKAGQVHAHLWRKG